VRLWAAAAACREALGQAPASSLRETDHPALSALRAALGEEAFTAAFAEGYRLAPDEAIEYALEE
jgi:hypothetical protein